MTDPQASQQYKLVRNQVQNCPALCNTNCLNPQTVPDLYTSIPNWFVLVNRINQLFAGTGICWYTGTYQYTVARLADIPLRTEVRGVSSPEVLCKGDVR
jgi:hypothetical protein